MLFNVTSPKYKHFHSMTFLINYFIKSNCMQKKFLDFEGSNIEGVKNFYAGFGKLVIISIIKSKIILFKCSRINILVNLHKMKYKDIFFDLDNTLWDFDYNSKNVLNSIYEKFDLKKHGVISKKKFINVYKNINASLWYKYREGYNQ